VVGEQLARQLVEQARTQGMDLVGPDGLLRRVTKLVLEGALEGELTDLYRPLTRSGCLTCGFVRIWACRFGNAVGRDFIVGVQVCSARSAVVRARHAR
jgi:hypothetical protein